MRALWLGLVAVAGCGRIAFDPIAGGDASDAPPDGLDPSLVLWLPFDGGMTDVISGTAASCVNSCPQPATGKTGMGLQFNGTNQCMQLADSGVTQLSTFTLALWMNMPAYGEYSLFAKPFTPATTDYNSWQIEDHSTAQMGFTTHDAGRHDVLYTTGPATGGWHHVATTFDGSLKRIYVDGALVMAAPEPDPVQYDTSAILVGCDLNTGLTYVYHYAGLLDDIRVYARPLGDAEIASLAR